MGGVPWTKEEAYEKLWIWVREQTNVDEQTHCGECLEQTPSSGKDVGKTFFIEQEKNLHLQALVFRVHLNHSSTCLRGDTAGDKQVKSFLKCIDGD